METGCLINHESCSKKSFQFFLHLPLIIRMFFEWKNGEGIKDVALLEDIILGKIRTRSFKVCDPLCELILFVT